MANSTFHFIESLDWSMAAKRLLRLAQSASQRSTRPATMQIGTLRGGGMLTDEFQRLGVSVVSLDSRWSFDPICVARLRKQIVRSNTSALQAWDSATDRVASQLRWLSPPADIQLSHTLQSSLPCTISTEFELSESRIAFLKRWRLPTDIELLGVGTPLTPQCGVKDLIWAYDLLRVVRKQTRLVVWGDGPARWIFERFARLAAEPHHVRFVGNQLDPREFLSHIDLFWAGTSTSGSHLLHDAMTARLPIVAAETPEATQLLSGSKTSLLVPPGNRAEYARATLRLLEEEPQLGNTVRQSVKQ